MTVKKLNNVKVALSTDIPLGGIHTAVIRSIIFDLESRSCDLEMPIEVVHKFASTLAILHKIIRDDEVFNLRLETEEKCKIKDENINDATKFTHEECQDARIDLARRLFEIQNATINS